MILVNKNWSWFWKHFIISYRILTFHYFFSSRFLRILIFTFLFFGGHWLKMKTWMKIHTFSELTIECRTLNDKVWVWAASRWARKKSTKEFFGCSWKTVGIDGPIFIMFNEVRRDVILNWTFFFVFSDVADTQILSTIELFGSLSNFNYTSGEKYDNDQGFIGDFQISQLSIRCRFDDHHILPKHRYWLTKLKFFQVNIKGKVFHVFQRNSAAHPTFRLQ